MRLAQLASECAAGPECLGLLLDRAKCAKVRDRTPLQLVYRGRTVSKKISLEPSGLKECLVHTGLPILSKEPL